MSKDKEPDILSIYLERFGSHEAIAEYRMYEAGRAFCVDSEKTGEELTRDGLMDEYERIGRNLSALSWLINNDKATEEHKQNADDLEHYFVYHVEIGRILMKVRMSGDLEDFQCLYLSEIDKQEAKNRKQRGGGFEVITEDSPLYKQEKDRKPDERN